MPMEDGSALMAEKGPREQTYQLLIRLSRPRWLVIGALGRQRFEAGLYCYTGSARAYLDARIARHLRRDKTLRWHIDYLLAAPEATVIDVRRSSRAECALNRATPGTLPIPGFGASDCHAGCGSHLKYLGPSPR